MRILYHPRIASTDGQAVHVEEIVQALRAAGHDMLLVGLCYSDNPPTPSGVKPAPPAR